MAGWDQSTSSEIEAFKLAVSRDVDDKVSKRIDELWQKGSKMLAQAQKRHDETTMRLSAEIARCRESQQALERDNEQLKQVLETLTCRLSYFCNAIGSAEAMCDVATAAPLAGAGIASSPAGRAIFPAGTPAALSSAAAAAVLTPRSPGLLSKRSWQEELASPAPSSSAAAGGAAGSAISGSEAEVSMPEIPPFPFPQTPSPFSLLEALGHTTPSQATPSAPATSTRRQALSLADSLPPTPVTLEASGPSSASSPSPGSAPHVFSFTLRKADGTHLGLNVSHHERDKVLCVEGVLPDGAVDAWNRQCMSRGIQDKAVLIGDKIIRVNTVTDDPHRMLEECKERQLLRLTICRGEGPIPELPQVAAADSDGGPAPSKSACLRADASEFVPRALEPAAETSASAPGVAAELAEAKPEATATSSDGGLAAAPGGSEEHGLGDA